MKRIFLALTLIAVTQPAETKRPGPTPTPPAASPEIAYIDTKPRYPELRLANEDLTGAFTVFRSVQQYTMPRYALSPRGQNQIALTNGGSAQLLTWSSNGSTVTVTSEPLVAAATQASNVAFSSDGTRIAVQYMSDDIVRIFDAATRNQVAEWATPPITWMDYYPSGTKVAFVQHGQPTVFELDVATGAITTHPFTAGSLQFVDGARSADALLVTYRIDEAVPESLFFGRWQNGVLTDPQIEQGWDARYNCNATRIVYRETGSRPRSLIYNVDSDTSNLLTRNTDIRRVDYVPTC